MRARVLEDHGDAAGAVAAQLGRAHVEARRRPSKLDLAVDLAPAGSSRAIARAVIDLPEPDSPTSPSASPAPI